MSRQKVLDVGAFYVATGNGHSKGSTVVTELAKVRRNYVATEQFYVMIEFARVGRNSVATEDFWVATELAAIKSFFAHDRVRCAEAGARARQCGVVLCRDRGGHVHAIDQARRA